ncbi:MAG: radical SAM protein [Candidatus Bathyarchaeota archaeon]|nr:radical SAM protein [Candidatus Bathyarchaeota archaeon]
MQIRVSLGTAIVLGLTEGKLDAAPTTAYLMTYREGKCNANCGFCPQAREGKSSTQLLSRVTWPTYPTQKALSGLKAAVEQKKIGRVCIQALNYPEVFAELEGLVKAIKSDTSIAVSVSCQPQTTENIRHLKQAGVDRLGIALDAATEAVFDRVKGKDAGGCYRWENQFQLFAEALAVFGTSNISTHVIVGLGETEREVVAVVERCVDLGVLPALFAFTPIRGTTLEANAPPTLESYRRIQLARYLIVNGKAKLAEMSFDKHGKIANYGLTKEAIDQIITEGTAFRTSGCPDCNRPYYNEKPSGPIYNHPKHPNKEEIKKIKTDLGY